MGGFRSLLGIRRMGRVPNARIRELCGVTNKVDERFEESVVLRWFGHIAKRVYVGECVGSHLLGQSRKRCIEEVCKQGEWCMIGVSGGGL